MTNLVLRLKSGREIEMTTDELSEFEELLRAIRAPAEKYEFGWIPPKYNPSGYRTYPPYVAKTQDWGQ